MRRGSSESTLWAMQEPQERLFAIGSRLGTWAETPLRKGRCEKCSATEVRVPLLILQWERGFEEVGDFVWPGFNDDVAVSAKALTVLRSAKVKGFETGGVRFRPPGRSSHCDEFPKGAYPKRNPKLFELWINRRVPLDSERTTTRPARRCAGCGREFRQLVGIERVRRGKPGSAKSRLARVAGKGLYVDGCRLPGRTLLRVIEYPGFILCSDEVRSVILEAGLTNIEFREMGGVVR